MVSRKQEVRQTRVRFRFRVQTTNKTMFSASTTAAAISSATPWSVTAVTRSKRRPPQLSPPCPSVPSLFGTCRNKVRMLLLILSLSAMMTIIDSTAAAATASSRIAPSTSSSSSCSSSTRTRRRRRKTSITSSTSDGSCRLVCLLPFTDRGKESRERPVYAAFSHMASTIMAMEHWNTRDSSIVPEIASDEFQSCTVQFPIEESVFTDDGDSPETSVRALLNVISGDPEEGDGVDDDNDEVETAPPEPPCAVIGSYSSFPAQAAAMIAAAIDAPYITHAAESTRIGRSSLYPLSTRTVVEEYARGDALMSYLKMLGRDYIALVYNFVLEDVVKVVDRAAKAHGMSVRTFPVASPWDGKGPNTPHDSMQQIKESGYRTIIVAVSRLFIWEHVAREAERFDLNEEGGYVWMTYDTTDFEALASVAVTPGSPRDKLLTGLGSVRVLDGFDWNPEDKFMNSWRTRDGEFVRKLNESNPIEEGKAGYLRAEETYFKDWRPSHYSSFIYDAVIALGMGACRARKAAQSNEDVDDESSMPEGEGGEDDGGNSTRLLSLLDSSNCDEVACRSMGQEAKDDFHQRHLQVMNDPGGNVFFSELVKVEFSGASGWVKLSDEFTFFRDPKTVAFGVYNMRPRAVSNPTSGERRFQYVLTAKKVPGQDWVEIEGEHFIYSDGTTNEPMPLRDVDENNYLSAWVRILGLTLMAVSLGISTAAAGWIFYMRSSTIVKSAQPEFLWALCFGSAVTSFSIFTLSFDESYGWDEDQLTKVCTAAPWFFGLGYIIVYSALFSKLKRVNRVLQFSRRRVKVWHVIGPGAVFFVLAVTMLSLWTALDPLTWSRTTINEDTGETYGECSGDNAPAFLVPLVVLMISSTVLAGFMAWKTKDVSRHLSETDWIFYAIFTQVQVWAVGLPILFIVDDVSVDATYLARVMVIWTFSVTMVLLIIGPRVATSFSRSSRATPGNRQSTTASTVVVTGVSVEVARRASLREDSSFVSSHNLIGRRASYRSETGGRRWSNDGQGTQTTGSDERSVESHGNTRAGRCTEDEEHDESSSSSCSSDYKSPSRRAFNGDVIGSANVERKGESPMHALGENCIEEEENGSTSTHSTLES